MNSHKLDIKRKLLTKRQLRIRKSVVGTPERPRLTLKLTNKNIYAQAINDTKGTTVVYLSSLNLDGKVLPNIAGAAALGEKFATEALKKGVKQVVFDRNGRRYHGAVKSFAEAVRKTGVQF